MKSNRHLSFGKPWLHAAILVTVGMALYLPTVSFSFVYDDHWTVLHNPSLAPVFPVSKFFLDAGTAAYLPSGISKDVYRPLSTLSFAVNKALFGLSPGSFHFFNVFVHLFNSILLWMLLRRRVKVWAALIGGGIFLLHPVQVESVAWISQRSILMCASGCLAGLLFWEGSQKRPGLAWAACGFFVLALLSKETALGLPFLFLAQMGGLKDKRLPPLLACIPIALAYLFLRRQVIGQWGQPVQYSQSLFSSLGDGMTALAHYARTILWPFSLNVSYQAPESVGLSSPGLWAGMAVLTGLILCAVYFRKRQPTLFLGVLIFLIFWMPHSGIVPLVTFAADRFLYLPLIGVVFVVALGFSLSPRALPLAVPLLAGCVFQSHFRVSDWKDEKTLWAASVKTDGDNPFALACYAQALGQEGDEAGAEMYYKKALSNRPPIGLARTVIPVLIRMYERRGDTTNVLYWKEKLKTVPQ